MKKKEPGSQVHYPFWYVPIITSPMWIAVVAVLHVYSAMYAVGGSILLAIQTHLAYNSEDSEYLNYLRNHTWFFVLFTVVYGALTGVGIWWTIGLASPLATEELIHIFVLGWGMEYVTFLVEIVAAFLFFYYWGRFTRRVHLSIAWIYVGAALGSLVIITAITAFQLNIGRWTPAAGFWRAFFNPQAVPQILARTGGSVLLASLYFFLHSTLKLDSNPRLRILVGTQSAKWAIGGAALTVIGGIMWYVFLPSSGKDALVGAAALNILMSIIFAVTAGVIIIMYLGPLRNPSWLTPGFAILFFGLGLTAVGTGEFIREAVRKPYIVYGRVLGSQIRPESIPYLRKIGYIEGGKWTKSFICANFPQTISNGKIDSAKLLELPTDERMQVGKTIFMYHCNDCHAVEGYSAVSELTRGWSRKMIYNTVTSPNRMRFFMPPWSGTTAEAELLTDYLQSIQHPYPRGLLRFDGEINGPKVPYSTR